MKNKNAELVGKLRQFVHENDCGHAECETWKALADHFEREGAEAEEGPERIVVTDDAAVAAEVRDCLRAEVARLTKAEADAFERGKRAGLEEAAEVCSRALVAYEKSRDECVRHNNYGGAAAMFERATSVRVLLTDIRSKVKP